MATATETRNCNGTSGTDSHFECMVICSTPVPVDSTSRPPLMQQASRRSDGGYSGHGLLAPTSSLGGAKKIGGSEKGTRRRGVSQDELNRTTPYESVTLRPKNRRSEKSMQKTRISLSSSDSDIVASLGMSHSALSSSTQGSPWFSRRSTKKTREDKRVSCKDVGGGDCEGWLWKRTDKKIGLEKNKWHLCWVVLKNRKLYCFKGKEDMSAQGILYLPGFKVSPAPEIKTRPFAFKVHHSGTLLYFASERQDDMAKWMNKMALATLENVKANDESEKAHFPHYLELDSENDDEFDDDDKSSRGSSRYASNKSLHSITSDQSREDLTDLYLGLVNAEIDIHGVSVRDKRSTVYRNDTLTLRSESQIDPDLAKCRKLLSLQRTLKDKEQCLADIEDFLTSRPITSQLLKEFTNQHPDLTVLDGDQTPLVDPTGEGWTPNWNDSISWRSSKIETKRESFV